ncbi:MAG TPA: NADP-dependent oxidoreductase [Nocardioidaceae bacterium]
MRAVVVPRPGDPTVLELADLAEPVPAPGQVVVGVEAAGVNPVDIGNRLDNTWASLECPYVLGYEFSGTLLDVNGCRTDLRPGDPVWGALPVRGTRWGAYAEQVAVDLAHVARRPPELDAAGAAAVPLAGGTAAQVLERLRLPREAWLLVYGAGGGVGHLLVQLAVQQGLRVAAVGSDRDRERVLALGAEVWVGREADDAAATVAAELGHDLDAAVDLVGGRLPEAQESVRDGGQLATIVDLTGSFETAVDRNLTLHGVLMRPRRDTLDQLRDAVSAGLRPRVVATFALEDAATAHERLEAGGLGGKLTLSPR